MLIALIPYPLPSSHIFFGLVIETISSRKLEVSLVIIGTLNRDPISLSKDQKDLVSSFGHPDTFILIMDDEMRYETWAYHTMERTFSFMDGIFLEEGTISDFENGVVFGIITTI